MPGRSSLRKSLMVLVPWTWAVSMNSCLEEINSSQTADITISPQIPLPLIDDEFKLGEFLKGDIENLFITNDSLNSEDEQPVGLEVVNGVSTLFFEDTLMSSSGQDLFNISEQEFLSTISAPVLPGVLQQGENALIPERQREFSIQTDATEQLERVDLKAGTLTVTLRSNIPAKTTLNLSFSSIIMADGSTLEQTSTVDGITSSPPEYSIDLQGATIDLSKQNTGFNTFTHISSAILEGKGQILTGTVIAYRIRLHDLEFKTLYGKFDSKQTQIMEGAINMNIFDTDNIQRNEYSFLNFVNPSVIFNIDNGFGLPTAFIIDRMSVVGSTRGEIIPLEGSALEIPYNNYLIAQPDLNEVGNYATTRITLDKDNCNMIDAFSAFPRQVRYRIYNKVGGLDRIGFISDSSRIVARVKAQIPLAGTTRDIHAERNYELNEVWEGIKQAIIKVETTNSIPIAVRIQVYFKDEDYNVTDSLFVDDEYTAEAAPTNKHGVSNEVVELTKEVLVKPEKIDRIRNAPIMSLTARMVSLDDGNQSIKALPENVFKIKVTSHIYIEYDLNN